MDGIGVEVNALVHGLTTAATDRLIEKQKFGGDEQQVGEMSEGHGLGGRSDELAGLLRLCQLPTKRLQLAIERLPFRTPPPHPFQQFLEFCAVPPPRAVNLRSQFVK